MKKIITTSIIICAITLFASQGTKAQKGYELGVRFGNYGSVGGSLDGTMPLGSNRLHADLIFYDKNLGLSVIYDWIIPVGGEGLLFYPGLGAAMYTYKGNSNIGLTAELGIEYPIAAIPLTIGLDWRPTFYLNGNDAHYSGVGLNLRFRF